MNPFVIADSIRKKMIVQIIEIMLYCKLTIN